jgi:DNA polymerase III delta prime subunit
MSNFFETSEAITAIAKTHIDNSRQILKSKQLDEVGIQLLGQNQELVTKICNLTCEIVERKAGLARHAQLVGVYPDRRLGDKAITSAILHNGEVIDLVVPQADLAQKIRPGMIGIVTVDHSELLDVCDEPPWECAVGIVRHITHANGHTTVDVGTEHGTNDVTMRLAWSLPPVTLEVGQSVYYLNRFVYGVRGGGRLSFLDSHKRSCAYNVGADEVFGRNQRALIRKIRAAVDRAQYPERYPNRNRDGESRLLVYGPPGFGKSESIRAAAGEAFRSAPNLEMFALDANAFRSKFVGETSERITGTFNAVNALAKDGKIVLLVIEEATSLVMDRSSSAGYLDSGVSLQATETFMASLDSAAGGLHENVILILTSNRADLMDIAGLARFVKIPVKTFGVDEFEAVLANCARRNHEAYDGAWQDGFHDATRAAMDTQIGTIFVGKEQKKVTVRHVLSGRMAQWVDREAGNCVDMEIFTANGSGTCRLRKITPALVHTAIVAQAVAEYTPYSLADCRDRFRGTDLCRSEKQGALSDPHALDLEEAELHPDYDARWALEEMVESTAGKSTGRARD